MTTKALNKKEALTFGWATTKRRLGFFVGLLLFIGAVYVLPQALVDRIQTAAVAIPLRIVLQLWQWFLLLGFLRIALKLCDGQDAAFADLFSGGHFFLPYVVGTILYGLIGLGGMILLIVPGIIWLIQFSFYSYLIVDKGLKAVDSLKASSAVTKGARWQLFVFGLLIGLINIAGALCLLVGLLVTIPLTLLAMAHAYRQLLAQSELPAAA